MQGAGAAVMAMEGATRKGIEVNDLSFYHKKR
jgi:hypothetical protein